jgi:hypothetical protein
MFAYWPLLIYMQSACVNVKVGAERAYELWRSNVSGWDKEWIGLGYEKKKKSKSVFTSY